MYMRDKKRKKRDATLKADFNPVYATYQDDSEPIAEVFCYIFFFKDFETKIDSNNVFATFSVQVEDFNDYYGEVYEGERSRNTDNNPLYD